VLAAIAIWVVSTRGSKEKAEVALARARADMTGEVAILGSGNHLQIWNRTNFEKKVEEEPLTLEDQNLLSSLGI